MNQTICYIFGAGDLYAESLQLKENRYIIAADGGIHHLNKLGIKPDITLGDFDSSDITDIPSYSKVFPKEKDVTDMFIAINHAVESGHTEIEIYGGFGGMRIDHSFANIATLKYFAEKGIKIIFHGNKQTVTAISSLAKSSISFDKNKKGYISVLSLTDKSEGVNLKGLKYTLDDYTLESGYPLGVSNEFIGSDSEISVGNGTLLIVFDE